MLALCAASAIAVEPRAQSVRVPMRDGVALATDVYLPPGDPGAPGFPTLLVRTPYDRSNPRLIRDAAPAVERGYALVIQDTRGRFDSPGLNLPFIGETSDDLDDGSQTLAWIAARPWCNGRVGMFGGSALGMTQLWAAARGPAPLEALHIAVAPVSFYHHMVYPGGVFREHLMRTWLAKNAFDPTALEQWLEHETYDDYWRARDLSDRYGTANVPAVHLGGYFDIFNAGTLESFNGYQHRGGPGARGRQKLVLGPWTHAILIEHSGVIRYPGADHPPSDLHDRWRWFDHHLRGIDNGIDREPPVAYYIMGDVTDPSAPGNRWASAQRWPPESARDTAYFLHADGALSPRAPRDAGQAAYRYDPSDPAPTVGGMQLFGGITAGTQDQRELEARGDVLTFSTPALTAPLTIAGPPTVELWFSSDARDTDVHVKLCDVHADGRSINVAEGQLRARFRESFSEPRWMEPGGVYRLTVPLSHTAIAFNTGHRVRLVVTSSSRPGFALHPLPANNTIHTGGMHASRIVLPELE